MENDLVKELGLRALATRLKRIADAMNHSARNMYRRLEMDMEPNWYLILSLIQKDKANSVVEIAQVMGFTHQSVTVMMDKMSQKGYLTKVKDPKDQRRSIFSLTPKAQQLLPRVREIWDCGEMAIREMLNHQSDILVQLDQLEDQLVKSSFGDRIIQKLKSTDND